MPLYDRLASPSRRRLLGAASGLLCLSAAGLRAAPPPIGLLGAPSNLGLRPLRAGHVPGAVHAPRVLRELDLARRLGAVDHGDAAAPAYAPARDPATGYRNGAALAAYTRELAQRIGHVLDSGAFALVLGGDCSVVLASTLALKKRGRYGLLFIDGHSDFYLRPLQETSSAAGTDLALATGHGPAGLVDIDHAAPYVREDDTVVFAYRDYGEPDRAAVRRFERAGFARFPLAQVRARGIAAAMSDALPRLENSALEGFWIHLDVDVVDPDLLPAVDSDDPGGLRWNELEDLLATALSSPRVRGMEVTIYDPDLDPDRRYGRQLVDSIARAFVRAGRVQAGSAA